MEGLSVSQFFLITAITFFAALMQSITGFGFALLTLPFFILFLDIQTAIQLTLIATLIITLVIIPFIYQDIPFNHAKRLIYASVLGFPFGFLFLQYATTSSIQMFVGCAILMALIMPIVSSRRLAQADQKPSSQLSGLPYGVVSGAMTTSIAMPGPALAFYAKHSFLSKQETRALIFAVFLFSYGAAIIVQLSVNGLYQSTKVALVYVLVPAILGTLIGHRFSKTIPEKQFRLLINIILALTSAWLLLSNLFKLLTS